MTNPNDAPQISPESGHESDTGTPTAVTEEVANSTLAVTRMINTDNAIRSNEKDLQILTHLYKTDRNEYEHQLDELKQRMDSEIAVLKKSAEGDREKEQLKDLLEQRRELTKLEITGKRQQITEQGGDVSYISRVLSGEKGSAPETYNPLILVGFENEKTPDGKTDTLKYEPQPVVEINTEKEGSVSVEVDLTPETLDDRKAGTDSTEANEQRRVFDTYMQALQKGDFHKAFAAAEKYTASFTDKTAEGLREWLEHARTTKSVEINVSDIATGKVPLTREQIADKIAKQLGFGEPEMEEYARALGAKDKWAPFFSAPTPPKGESGSGKDTNLEALDRLMIRADKDGRVRVGELNSGAIQMAKQWLEQTRQLKQVGLTEQEKVQLDAYNLPANFAAGVLATTGDAIQGTSALGKSAVNLVDGDGAGGDRNVLDEVGEYLREKGESLPLMNSYSKADLNDATRVIAFMYARNLGAVAPFVAGGEVLQSAKAGERAVVAFNELLGAASNAGSIYDAARTLSATDIARQEFGQRKFSAAELESRVKEIKENKNIDPEKYRELETNAQKAASVAAAIGAAQGRLTARLTNGTGTLAGSVGENVAGAAVAEQANKLTLSAATGAEVDLRPNLEGAIAAGLSAATVRGTLNRNFEAADGAGSSQDRGAERLVPRDNEGTTGAPFIHPKETAEALARLKESREKLARASVVGELRNLEGGSESIAKETGYMEMEDGEIMAVVLRAAVDNDKALPRQRVETIAGDLNVIFGFDNKIPVTAPAAFERNGRSFQNGYAQERIGNRFDVEVFNVVVEKYGSYSVDNLLKLVHEDPQFSKQMEAALAERLIYGVTDTHDANFLISKDRKVLNIDLGDKFPENPEPFMEVFQSTAGGEMITIKNSFSEKPLSPELKGKLSRFLEQYDTPAGRAELQNLGMSEKEVHAMISRVKRMESSGRFPKALKLQEMLQLAAEGKLVLTD